MGSTEHTFTMTERSAELVHAVVASHMQALKNWVAGCVERDDLVEAKRLVIELREYEPLFAAFNMPAKHSIAEGRGQPVTTVHTVRGVR